MNIIINALTLQWVSVENFIAVVAKLCDMLVYKAVHCYHSLSTDCYRSLSMH